MPHDKNGTELKAGDVVIVEFVVEEVYATEDFCNVRLKTKDPMFPGNNHDKITLNAKQTLHLFE